jgi:hypothetical protein
MSAPQTAKRSWPQEIMCDPHIKSRDDEDGLCIMCLPCSITLGVDVPIKTKDGFAKHGWMQHAQTSQKHAASVKEYEHAKEKKKKKPNQTSMGSYFRETESAKKMSKRDNLTSTETAGRCPQSNPPTAKRAAQFCEGVLLNAHPGGSVSAALQLCHKHSSIPDAVIMKKFGTTLCHRMFSSTCDGRARKDWRGARCENCEKLRDKSGKGLLSRVTKRSKVFRRMEEALFKSHLCDMDRGDMTNVLRTSNMHLSHCGISLKTQVKHTPEFVNECLKLDKSLQTKQSQSSESPAATAESPDVFLLAKFLDTCKTNPEFAGSLICGLLRAAVAKMSGQQSPPHATHVLNFCSMIESSSRKSFEMVSANLFGPSLRQMQRVNAKQRS